MRIQTVRRTTLEKAALLAAVLVAGYGILNWPQAVTTGISRGLAVCGSVLIPGLLPFLVLAGFLVKSGLCDSLGRRLEPLMRGLFCLPGCCAAAVLIGLCGGYPAGAAAVQQLYQRGMITRQQGRRLLRFCVNAGPAFVISTVGAGLLRSVRAGAVLYAAQMGASLLIGVADGRWERWKKAPVPAACPNFVPACAAVSPAVALVESVNAACRSLLSMCGFVMLSSALLSVLDAAGITAGLSASPAGALLTGLLEVSCGCVAAAGEPAMPLVMGAVLGWGGLSVHGQIAAMLAGTGLMDRGFTAFRLIEALLSGLISTLLFRLVPMPAAVWQPLGEGVSVSLFSGSVTGGVALLLMCGTFLLGTGKKIAQ